MSSSENFRLDLVFIPSKTFTLNVPLGALNAFCGSKMPLLERPSCYVGKTSQTVLVHQL